MNGIILIWKKKKLTKEEEGKEFLAPKLEKKKNQSTPSSVHNSEPQRDEA